ncbi:MAG TPA: hypothetical protein VGZ29_06275 [Terriglobia bacterium]|nr:hypothetical protein [Terriglobia bacterium]
MAEKKGGRQVGSGEWRGCLLLLLAATFQLSSVTALGQTSPWSGILDPSRATDWTKAGIPGGIPNYTEVCRTVALRNTGNPSDDGRANSNAIEKALNACSGNGQAVIIPAGTWYVAGLLPKDALQQVVLRGAGPLETILKFTETVAANPPSDVRIKGDGGILNSTTWTGTNGNLRIYKQGATVLDVGSTSGFSTTPGAPGNLIVLDQRNDSIGVARESETGSVVTITTTVPHGFSTGDTVMVGRQMGGRRFVNSGYHGVWTISAAGPCSGCAAGGGSLKDRQFQFNANGTCSVTGASWLPNTATLKLNCRKQSVDAGDALAVTGLNSSGPGGYNGSFSALTGKASNGTVFVTYALGTDPGTHSSGGSITWTRTGLGGGPGTPTDYVARDTGGVFICDISNACIDSNNTYIGQACGTGLRHEVAACQTGEVSRRSQQEVKQVISIDRKARTITVTPPVEMTNWRTSQAPGIWWNGATAYRVGIENMTLDYSGDGKPGSGGLVFSQAAECWVKNIRSLYGGLNHVMAEWGAAQIEVVDSYFYGKKHGGPEAYGINLLENSDSLIQNDIFQNVEMMMPEEDTGSVFAYNYQICGVQNNRGWLGATLYANHGINAAELYEGNDASQELADNIHGTGTSLTFFRNRIRGQDTPAMRQHLMAVTDHAFNRAENFIGNSLGTGTAETRGYQITTGRVFPSGYIYSLGSTSQNGTAITADSAVSNSLLPWGNYDTYTNAVRWCGNSFDPGWTTTCNSTSEIPTAGVAFINGNPVPPTTSLPKSLYLGSAPPFWATRYGIPPWPAIGPDVTGGDALDGAGGFSYAIPAQLCYVNTAYDRNYQVPYKVTNASWSSNVATLTLSSAWKGAINGTAAIVVGGVSVGQYNGTWQVTGGNGSTITFTLPLDSDPGTGTGGTATDQNVLAYSASTCYLQPYPWTSKAPAQP